MHQHIRLHCCCAKVYSTKKIILIQCTLSFMKNNLVNIYKNFITNVIGG